MSSGRNMEAGEEFIVTYIQDRKSEFVWICVCLFVCLCVCVCVWVCLCMRERAEGKGYPQARLCQRESTAKLLLMWRTWWMLLNSIETLHYSDPPQVHKAHCSITETLQEALMKTLNDWHVSKVCVHRLLQTLQPQHCIGTACPQGGAVSPGTQWVCAHNCLQASLPDKGDSFADLVSVITAESTIAPHVTYGNVRSCRLLIFEWLHGEWCSNVLFNELSGPLAIVIGYSIWSCWKWIEIILKKMRKVFLCLLISSSFVNFIYFLSS